MPGSTPRGFPYPLPTDSINVPRDMQALAEALDLTLEQLPLGIVAHGLYDGPLTLAIPLATGTPLSGMNAVFNADPSRVYKTSVWANFLGEETMGAELRIVDGTGVRLQGGSTNHLHPASGTNVIAMLIEGGLSGQQTRRAVAAGIRGDVTLEAGFPLHIMVEDLGAALIAGG